jgi:hypothetical protein
MKPDPVRRNCVTQTRLESANFSSIGLKFRNEPPLIGS